MGATARQVCAFTAGALAVLLLGQTAHAATIDFTGGFVASDLGTTLVFTIPTGPTPVYAYESADDGSATATAFAGFTSLAGEDPADITLTLSDLELLSVAFSPGGCTPDPAPGWNNCDTASLVNGEGDASQNYFNVELAGTGTILTGEIITLTTLIDTDEGSAGFGTGVGTGTVLFTGGIGPYYAEALALTGGTGVADLTLDTYDAVCFPGSDPCNFNISGTVSFVPEPSTGLLVGLGVVALATRRRSFA